MTPVSAAEEPPTRCCVRHWLPHPASTVYDAFLDPETLQHWYGPDGLHPELGSAYVDARPGGTWRLVLTDERDHTVRVAVERTIRRLVPERLVEAEEQDPTGETVLWTVALTPAPEGTTVEVQEGPLPAAFVRLSATGWEQSLGRLETVLGGRPGV